MRFTSHGRRNMLFSKLIVGRITKQFIFDYIKYKGKGKYKGIGKFNMVIYKETK